MALAFTYIFVYCKALADILFTRERAALFIIRTHHADIRTRERESACVCVVLLADGWRNGGNSQAVRELYLLILAQVDRLSGAM